MKNDVIKHKRRANYIVKFSVQVKTRGNAGSRGVQIQVLKVNKRKYTSN